MKSVLLLVILVATTTIYSQRDERISTIDFVQILGDNENETNYYYQNNWKVLRTMALERGYIHSFEVLETPSTEDANFHLMLITTYANKEQYEKSEDHFAELIKEKGGLNLLNNKKPSEFRKNLFNKSDVRHWKTADK